MAFSQTVESKKEEGLFHYTESGVAQSCPTLCDPMDGSLPGSSIHAIFKARVLEWVAIAFSKDEMVGWHN